MSSQVKQIIRQTLQALIIDSREPEDIQQLDFGCPSVVTALECGDLWASCADGELLVIERKTPSDRRGGHSARA